MIFIDKTYILILIASIFKTIGGATIGYFGVFFFTQVYADYDKEYSILSLLIALGGGIPSSIIGGYLGDYFESEKGGKKLYMKGLIPAIGTLISCIFIPTCYIIKINFWVSLISLYLIALSGEVSPANSLSMINKTIPLNL